METERWEWVDVGDQVRQRENVGSTARDHLANERTYLAWLRTGFGTAALGLAVAKLLGDPGDWKAIAAGIVFVVLGVAMLVYGTLRFYKIVRALDEGLMQVSRSGPIIFGIVSAFTALIVTVLILS